MSEPIQAIATNNYLLATPVGSGYMETSALEYDGDKISGYSGSAFKAGDEFPQSATEAIGYVTATSANIDSTIDNVSSNSGAWGGSALPISAGPGIKVNLIDNTLVFSNDETVLYSGERTSACVLSENPTNFYRIRVEDFYHNLYEFAPFIGDAHQEIKLTNYTGQPQQLFVQFSSTNDTLYVVKGFQTVYSTWDNPGNATWTATNINNTYSREIIKGVTGINRIAGGN